MKLVVNGTARDAKATTLAELLAELGYSGTVATAVNETFVPATSRDSHALNDGDRIEILAPMQGG